MPDNRIIQNSMFHLFDKINHNEVYVIAEMSANHGGSLENALEIVRQVAKTGADCLKIQTYTADSLTIDCDNEYFRIEGGLWDGQKLYDLYSSAGTPYEWQPLIKKECEKCGLDFLSTPFDRAAVDFLEDLGVEAYKIASFELVDIPLIEYTASKGKPMIISCGMGSPEEIQDALDACNRVGNKDVVLLKCCSEYPANWEDMYVGNIPDMKNRFHVNVGLSDHSPGSIAAVVGVAMGACVIEKHVKLDGIESADSEFSMSIQELEALVKDIRNAKCIAKGPNYELTAGEKSSTVFRRSIFAVKDICAGERFSEENIRIIRPGYGVKPKVYNSLIGRECKRDIKRGEPIVSKDLQETEKAGFDRRNAMKIILLSNNSNSQILYEWLLSKEYEVLYYHDRVTVELIDEFGADFVISYNYGTIIKEDVIDRMKGRIINLHISYLPWNRGSSPNLWSFIEDTPKGVTIHRLEKGLDTGQIILQKKIEFDENTETLSSSYDKLNEEIVRLLIDNWDKIVTGNYEPIEQSKAGSYHRRSDLEERLAGREIDYGMTIAEFKKFIQ